MTAADRGRLAARVFVTALLLTGPFLARSSRAGLSDDLAAARRAWEGGDLEAARNAFLQISKEHGDDAGGRDAWYGLALLSRSGPDYLKYLDLFLDHGGRKDRRGPYVELRAGRYYYALGEYRTALTRFESARELRRDDLVAAAEARYWVGLSLTALREPGEARRALQEAALPRSPDTTREAALMALGELARMNRDYAGAARDFAHYRDLYPAGSYVPASLLGEATARELLGHPREAEPLYRRIAEKYPMSPEAAQARQWLRAAEEPRPAPPPAPAPSVPLPGAADTDAVAPPPSPALDTQGFAVQVGAFASEGNAMRLADDLIARGYSRVRVQRGKDEARLYHVLFGNYPDLSRAERAGQEVSATLGVDFDIVPPPSAEPGTGGER